LEDHSMWSKDHSMQSKDHYASIMNTWSSTELLNTHGSIVPCVHVGQHFY
jgi:hypothetical protein